jgi:hypothetical protein
MLKCLSKKANEISILFAKETSGVGSAADAEQLAGIVTSTEAR